MTRSRSLFRSGLVALLALMLPAAGAAMSTVIDFDTLPDESASVSRTPLADSYASLGVVFDTLDPDAFGPPQFLLRSVGNIAARDTIRSQTSTLGFHIFASFATPVSSISFDAFTGSSGMEFVALAIAFDAGGSELGRVESERNSAGFKGRFTLEEMGAISSVLWTTDLPFVSSISIDDLQFRIVPEPTTSTLLALGLAALAARARTRRRG